MALMVKCELGQVMLTSAFLLAIVIIIVTIMLNNLIYSNNVAYLGLSDQSQYDDLSIMKMTVDEMNYALNVANGDQSMFAKNFTAFISATNNMTLTKGTHVQNSSPVFTSGDVTQQLYVSDKDSSKTYVIKSKSQAALTPGTYHGGRDPGNVIVRLGANDTTLRLGEHVLLIVEVVNSTTYMPEPNVTVNFTVPAGALMANGNEHLADASGNIKGKHADLHTDDNGYLFVDYYLTSLVYTVRINASVGPNPDRAHGNLSNDVTMILLNTNEPTPTPTPTATPEPTPTPTPNPTPVFDHLTITVTDPWQASSDTITVTAIDQFGNQYDKYTGKVYFSSSINGDSFTYDKWNKAYAFTASDSGRHVFVDCATLKPGNKEEKMIHTIWVIDLDGNQAEDTTRY
ncbi:hypothetical protein [Methanocella arvoryzae]|uniref:Uncharacterized protein n=1 Tax=Methanocella arvoryzae (strain DSM 22066 / NBRC 105507 / MRE50) TaxID=351160 RepID=Q0W742_METAR|nr:hypothetical protein [Methanocella arvoryzae]CAJ35801.1 hypothetical protein RCIX351 [Methanocella arvoryzae MRE50]